MDIYLPANTTATTTATIARVGGFTGDITLSQTGAPAGVTVSFAPNPIAAGATSSAISVRASTTAAPGTYPIVISAAGTGISAPTVTYTLTVVPVPTLSVSVAPTATSIVAGANGSATATIVRGGGFADAVSMTAAGAPVGMTIAFTPASIAAGATTSAMAITVGSGVAAAVYSIAVTATGTGVAPATATLQVTVTAVVSGTTVTVSYCAADAPIWLAYQDGSGGWTRVSPNSGTNTYAFPVASGKLGLATVDTVGTGFDLSVTYATTAEANAFGGAIQLGGCGGKTVNGTVSNVANTEFANVTLGYRSAFVIPITSSAFSLTNVADGAQDLFAARLTAATQRADKVIVRRGVNVSNGGSLAVLDFNAAEAFSPVAADVTVIGMASDTANIISLFNGTRGSTYGFLSTISDYVASSGAKSFDAVPLSRINSGELQQLFVNASAANDDNSSRFTGIFFRTPTDFILQLGAALATPTFTRNSAGAYSRVRVQLASQTDYNRFVSAEFNQASLNRHSVISATGLYTGFAGWDLTIPDLSGVAGWNATWGLQNGTAITWAVSAQSGPMYLLDPNVLEYNTMKGAQRAGAAALP